MIIDIINDKYKFINMVTLGWFSEMYIKFQFWAKEL